MAKPRKEIVPAMPEHVDRLAPRLRAADVREVWAAGHYTADAALRMSLETSVEAWTGLVDGVPVAMWGVAAGTTLSGVGTPWLLAAEGFPRGCLREFLRVSRRQVQAWLADFEVLANAVDARNHASIGWLTWLGAAFEAPEPHGPDGVPFRRFTFRR